ncbi:class IV lanthionine synthetase LanL [Kitasatospora sp. NPDC049285]|uniref:class IV lanthionine synthetase LanL n=1 Tax=Kitasatospora sp. NPDC049285 TaxID=3157096 RepID=UPI00343B4D7D
MSGSIAGRGVRSDDTWSYLTDPRMPAMDHGWKLHVSTRPGELDAVTALVLPVLERHVCHAKWARTPETLRELNSGAASPGAVGKAITVYPAPETALALADELVALLRGREGPQVVSDRRVDPDAPVYYRYGPFTGSYRTGRSGRTESVMVGPDGRLFDGLATGAYRCPPWATDPFAARTEVAPGGEARGGSDPGGLRRTGGLGGGRYRVTGGIARKPHGNVYRAIDTLTGRQVIVKQARAYVAEDESGADTRDRLRNERLVLAALATAPGVPRALDAFRHRADEYLVMTSCGDRDLRREVQLRGPYPADATLALAARLLRVLDAIHQHGVVVRDLKPDNVVLDADGHPHLVDFGISSLHGQGPDGATPGYNAPVRRPDGPAAPADDYYALGATLCYAATGLDPVVIDPSHTINRDRTLATLAFALPGPSHHRFRTLIAELTSFDPTVRTAGAARLRSAETGSPTAPDDADSVPRTPGHPLAPTHPHGRPDHHHLDDGVLAATITPDPASLPRPHGRPDRHHLDDSLLAATITPDPASLPRPHGRPDRHHLDDSLLAEIIDHTTAFCVAEAHRLTDPALAARAAVPTAVDVYGGTAGLGLELLHHLHRPGVREAVDTLAAWTATAAARSRHLSPSFWSGRTGVELFLAQAGLPPTPGSHPTIPHQSPDGGPPEADFIEGIAGIGIGRLLLARTSPTPHPVDVHRVDHLAVAAECHRLLTSGEARLSPTGADRPGSAALRQGLAHGDAGVAYFLLEYAHTTGDPEATRQAHQACTALAAATPDILAAATAPGATRRYGSWCRGLAGIGAVLVRAADRLAAPEFLALAQQCARTCTALAPRMPLVTQCCGLSGVGDLMLDLAQLPATTDEFLTAADTIAALILTRAGGPPSRPTFPDTTLTHPTATWAGGSAGVLTFLRRLQSTGGPRLGLLD